MSTNKQIAISVKNLTKKFGSFAANKNLCFDVFQGEIFGFLGANGAGKTTAIKILCGLSKPTTGNITIAGFNVYTDTEKIKKNIGYMSQKFSLYNDLTVFENIQFFAGIYGMSRKDIKKEANNLLEKLNLLHARDKLIGSLPLGWKQKLAFSIAIIHKPRIVFLDEPTGGVDPITRRQFWEMIYEAAHNGITVFVTTHYMDEAEYCDRLSIMVEGEIKAIGKPLELINKYNTKNMDEVFVKLARSSNEIKN
ncbi:MAG: ABC transporter ATP-binding protein [Bacteroidales bacterium]|jgi:ABC-2 type transport system ATP-binding protein|nr:ABC transporter ATP-binding protein [Bacteroidales bacterium]